MMVSLDTPTTGTEWAKPTTMTLTSSGEGEIPQQRIAQGTGQHATTAASTTTAAVNPGEGKNVKVIIVGVVVIVAVVMAGVGYLTHRKPSSPVGTWESRYSKTRTVTFPAGRFSPNQESASLSSTWKYKLVIKSDHTYEFYSALEIKSSFNYGNTPEDKGTWEGTIDGVTFHSENGINKDVVLEASWLDAPNITAGLSVTYTYAGEKTCTMMD
ncbi:MAG: hypothetical protein NTV86_17350 [Planctomycetota bacterium]|nr:hypothetical protein [Planctomycetota bacterium]